MSEMSLRVHLKNKGWNDKYLSIDRSQARLGGVLETYFIPFSRWQRFFSKQKIPVKKIIKPGYKIKFLKSLKHDIYGDDINRFWGLGVFWFLGQVVMKTYTFFKKTPLPDMTESVIAGFVEGNKHFSEFPFDKYLTVLTLKKV